MGNQDILNYIMIGIMLLCGYLFLLQVVTQRTENKGSIPFIAIMLLLIYLFISVPVLFIISTLGNTGMIVIALLLLFACVAVFFSIYGLFHHFRDINKGMLALFLTYMLAVGYVTLFSQDRLSGTSAGAGQVFMFRFDMFQEAFRTRSLEPINHIILNVAMFVPFGFLLPMIYPEKLSRLSYAVLMGLMFTTIIEFTQMIQRLGQAELTDIITNSLGAIIGYLFYKVFARFRRPVEEE